SAQVWPKQPMGCARNRISCLPGFTAWNPKDLGASRPMLSGSMSCQMPVWSAVTDHGWYLWAPVNVTPSDWPTRIWTTLLAFRSFVATSNRVDEFDTTIVAGNQ